MAFISVAHLSWGHGENSLLCRIHLGFLPTSQPGLSPSMGSQCSACGVSLTSPSPGTQVLLSANTTYASQSLHETPVFPLIPYCTQYQMEWVVAWISSDLLFPGAKNPATTHFSLSIFLLDVHHRGDSGGRKCPWWVDHVTMGGISSVYKHRLWSQTSDSILLWGCLWVLSS
jgi:hypothetical protein